MAEYIFYTMVEGSTQGPNGNPVENGQLMGRAFGTDRADALANLLSDNPWIEECGYDPHGFECCELAPCDHAEAVISHLIDMLTERQLEEYMKWLKHGNENCGI